MQLAILLALAVPALGGDERPNVLFAISDDQSWPHASAYGSTMVSTPSFDRLADAGVLFTRAYTSSPGCSPARASLLTGLYTWQLEHAGTHGSWFDPKFETWPDRLAAAGYHVGSTGKGWAPGNAGALGRSHNPAGPAVTGGRGKSFAERFALFLERRPEGAPFCFWFGTSDPHRGYERGSGLAAGKELADAEVPACLPDAPEVRSDLLDYAFEVERWDRDLGEVLAVLEETGELERTIVIATSDNGAPFPRMKANGYEYGIHVPLAVRYPAVAEGGRVVDDLVGFVDLAATIYEATGVEPPAEPGLVGESLLALLASGKSGVVEPERDAVYSARERHSSSRYGSLGYPQRAIRSGRWLYIRNFTPERWPAGAPRKYASAKYDADGALASGQLGPEHGAYHDIDGCPTLTFLVENRDRPEVGRFLDLAVAKRPAEELFDVEADPACLRDLAADPEHAGVRDALRARLLATLERTGDPRATGDGDVWETYPRVSRLRWFPVPDWAAEDPERAPRREWLEARRPRSD